MHDDNPFTTLLILLPFIALTFFSLFRSRRKVAREREEMKARLLSQGWQLDELNLRTSQKIMGTRAGPPLDIEGFTVHISGHLQVQRAWDVIFLFGEHHTQLRIEVNSAPNRWAQDWRRRLAELPEHSRFAHTLKADRDTPPNSLTRTLTHWSRPRVTEGPGAHRPPESSADLGGEGPLFYLPEDYSFEPPEGALEAAALQMVLGLAELSLSERELTHWLASPHDALGRPRSVARQARLLTVLYQYFWSSEEAKLAQGRALQAEDPTLRRYVQIYRLNQTELLPLIEAPDEPAAMRHFALRRVLDLMQRARDQAGQEALVSTLTLSTAHLQILSEALLLKAHRSDLPVLWRLFERIYTQPQWAQHIFDVLEKLGGLDDTRQELVCCAAPRVRQATLQRLLKTHTPTQVADLALNLLRALPLKSEGEALPDELAPAASPESERALTPPSPGELQLEQSQATLLRLVAQYGDHRHLAALKPSTSELRFTLERLRPQGKDALEAALYHLEQRKPVGLTGSLSPTEAQGGDLSVAADTGGLSTAEEAQRSAVHPQADRPR